MGVWRSGAFMDLDEEPCGLWSRLARYGACNCRHGMWCRLLAARCTATGFGGGHEPPGDRPARRRGAGVAASPTGRRWTSLHTAGRSAGDIPAPPTGGASTGGRFLGTPMGVLCEPPGTVPSIDGTVCGAGYCRHGMVPPGTVPPIGGTVSPGDGKARDGRARRGLAGMLGRSLEPPAFWLAGIPAARAAWNCRFNPGICARLRAGGKLGRGSSAFLSGPRVFIYGPRAFLQGPRGFPQERNAFLQGAGFLE